MKKTNSNQESTMITADRLVSIEGYVPSPADGKFHVMRTNDVTIFKAFDPKKPKTAARALYAIARVPKTPDNASFISTYGPRVIIVSKKFLKMRKKMQLMLIEKACFEAAGVPERFISGEFETTIDKQVAAELQLMEKYGYSKVKRLMKKEFAFNMSAIKYAGKCLYKAAKKSKKLQAKNNQTIPNTVPAPNQPVTFDSVDAAPAVG